MPTVAAPDVPFGTGTVFSAVRLDREERPGAAEVEPTPEGTLSGGGAR